MFVTRGQPRQDTVQFTSNNIASVLPLLFVCLPVCFASQIGCFSSVGFSCAVDLCGVELTGATLETSHDTLVWCVLKVDL